MLSVVEAFIHITEHLIMNRSFPTFALSSLHLRYQLLRQLADSNLRPEVSWLRHGAALVKKASMHRSVGRRLRSDSYQNFAQDDSFFFC